MNYNYSFQLFFQLLRRINLLLIFICPHIINAQDEVKTAQIQLHFSEESSKKYITAKVNELINDSIGKAIGELDLYFYVQRTFSLLPIGDYFNTTDENGEVTVEFPSDMPGDSVGNVTIIIKLLDAESYADSEVKKTVTWGIPTSFNSKEHRRTLWAAGANAPISLLLLVNILIAAVWGVIFFIIFKLYKISKM